MSEEFLAKVKGNKAVFVVHSNTNPYAAAAAMGMMMARSQRAGRFFRLSDRLIPMVEGFAAEEINSGSAPDQIGADFKGDWSTYLRNTGLPECGLRYLDSKAPEQNTIRFLNASLRRIPPMKVRRVRHSRELSIPSEYLADYVGLVALIEAGGDLKPYLSRDIIKKKRPDRNDGLLNSWGIQHLHFRQDGTDRLLFCVITEAEVFVIQALPHDAEHLWVNTELVQILHNNWPELIAHAKHSGLRSEEIPAAKRSLLRGYNANFAITVRDQTVYLPPTGGTMASGDSQDDWVNCDKIFLELDYWQRTITHNAQAIRTALNMPDSRKLVVRMAFDNRECCFYEPTRAIRLGGFAC